MHPAFSVIFFTTASGAGYGLLAMLGTLAAAGHLPPDRTLRIVSLGLALVLITAGLLSSTLHLGRPERAWRAFSQWRSSWLSREGIASVITFVPTGIFGLASIVDPPASITMAVAGVVMAACAIATLVTTGMIYASLKPIAQWHSRYTVPGYVLYGLMSGAVLLAALLLAAGQPGRIVAGIAIAGIALGWIFKLATWRHNDSLGDAVSAGSATGLGDGTIRSVEWPHSEENYVMKEMGYRIARKHAIKLRAIVQVLAFAIPLALVTLTFVAAPTVAVTAAIIAACAQGAGLLVERWLFFAEAKHVVGLYYGR
jgi:sulfite dehydrogenase (quinone) subunit SoeC